MPFVQITYKICRCRKQACQALKPLAAEKLATLPGYLTPSWTSPTLWTTERAISLGGLLELKMSPPSTIP